MKQILDEKETASFLEALSRHKILKNRLWIMLSFSIGLRQEEIFGLQWKDINFNKRLITSHVQPFILAGESIIIINTKSDNSYRLLSIPLDVIFLLQQDNVTLPQITLVTAVKLQYIT